jgi:hypothetical protein
MPPDTQVCESLGRTQVLLAAFLVLLATADACSDTPTTPAEATPIRLLAEISQPVLSRGESATITFRLENVSANEIRLSFSSSCQLTPYILERDTSRVVLGGGACLTVITNLVLPPGGSVTREVQVRAAEVSASSAVLLGPGQYVSYARLEDFSYKLTSPVVSLTVQ